MRKTSVDLEQRQFDIAEAMAENGDADTQSEAIRDALEYYGQDMGYINGRKVDTELRWAIRQMGQLFIYIGIGLVAALYWFPVGFRATALAPIFVGLVALAIDKALARFEPSFSRRMVRLVGGEQV